MDCTGLAQRQHMAMRGLGASVQEESLVLSKQQVKEKVLRNPGTCSAGGYMCSRRIDEPEKPGPYWQRNPQSHGSILHRKGRHV
jgi:hypothetical protein